ncbi:MAG: hypothetical protein IJO43_03030 [Bacilli bacterium]|nr:hypothetical protein [Bacilli bacterium]
MNKIIDVFRKIACLFLSVILFFVICFYLILTAVPKIVVKENVQILLKEITTETLIYNGQNSFIEELNSEIKYINPEKDLLSGILNKDNFREIISNYYAEMTEALLYNKKEPKLNSKEIIKVIKINFDEVVSSSGLVLSVEEKEKIMEYINDNADRIIEMVPTAPELFDKIGQDNVDALRSLVGPMLKVVLIIIMLIIVAFIALVSWSTYKFAAWSGGTTIVSGLTIMVMSSLLYDIAVNYTKLIISSSLRNLIENNILKTITTTGTIAIVIGAIQILYYFLMKKRNLKY